MSQTALRDGPRPAAGRPRWFDKGEGTALDRLPLLGEAFEGVARA